MTKFKMTRMVKSIPDVELEFESEFPKGKFVDILDGIADCHVMSQTVETFESYTGERVV